MADITLPDFELKNIRVTEDKQVILENPSQTMEIPQEIGIGKSMKQKLKWLKLEGIEKCTLVLENSVKPGRDENYWLRFELDSETLELYMKKTGKGKKKKSGTDKKENSGKGNEKSSSEKSSEKQIDYGPAKPIDYGPALSILLDEKYAKKKRSNTIVKGMEISSIFKSEVIETLALKPSMKIRNFTGVGFNQNRVSKLLQIKLNSAKEETIGGIAVCLYYWYQSILERNVSSTIPPYQGYVMSNNSGLWFGIAPGFPQFIIKDIELSSSDSSLALGIYFSFDKFEINDEGRLVPRGIESILPPYPERPKPIIIKPKSSRENLCAILLDEDGELKLKTTPIALVIKKLDDISREEFKTLVIEIAKEFSAEVLFEKDNNQKKWPKTYTFIEHWCLLYLKENRPDGVVEEKKTHYFNEFPIYLDCKWKLTDRAFAFDWMTAARGLVHDLAHPHLLALEKEKMPNRWLIIGDETGGGKEHWHESDGGDGTPQSMNKRFAYIWVLIPPNVMLPSTSSDFHAMDQNKYFDEHVNVLEAIANEAESGVSTLIFESPTFVNKANRMPLDDKKSQVPQIIKSTLPLVLEYISRISQGFDLSKPIMIRTMSEQQSWMKAGVDSEYLMSEMKKWVSNLHDRGNESLTTMKKKNTKIQSIRHEIMPKLDHPWMNYPDAVGFLQTDQLHPVLKQCRDSLEKTIVISPLHLDFLETTFPELAITLGRNSITFIERLFDCNVIHLSAYMNPYLSGMINEAFGKMGSIDWRTLNELMKTKGSTEQGRIIYRKLLSWIEDKLPQLLDTLDSDYDRLNTCLTCAWGADQQGGKIKNYLDLIDPKWWEGVDIDRVRSYRVVSLADRQNRFDINHSMYQELTELGILTGVVDGMDRFHEHLMKKPPVESRELNLLGILFADYAFSEYSDAKEIEMLYQCNSQFIDSNWPPPSAIRHCIYGAEFCLNYVGISAEWFEKARSRLYDDFEKFGEHSEHPFWWPAAARYITLACESGIRFSRLITEPGIRKSKKESTLNVLPAKYLKKDGTPDLRFKVAKDWVAQMDGKGVSDVGNVTRYELTECDFVNDFVKNCEAFYSPSQQELIVNVRISYWLLRMSIKLDIDIPVEKILEHLFGLLVDEEYNCFDVYGLILILHLIDINERMKLDRGVELQEHLEQILLDSFESTRKYYYDWKDKNPNRPIVECLRFNYS